MIPFAERHPLDVGHRPADLGQMPHGHVPRHDRERHPRHLPVMQMHVGAAHLGIERAQHRAPRRERGPRQLAELEGLMRRRHHGGTNGLAHDRRGEAENIRGTGGPVAR